MESLIDLFGMGASVASGGLFGFLGSISGQVSRYFQERQQQQIRREDMAHEINLLNLQMAQDKQETELELQIAQSEGSWNGLNSSINADTSTNKSYKWVDAIKSLFRPFVTTLLWFLSAYVFSETHDIEELPEIYEYMIYTIYFTTASATMWWFGDRAMTPSVLKNK